MNKIKRIKELITELHTHDALYSVGNPIITDKAYDDLYFELQQLEKETGIIYPNSPTQTIYYEKVDGLEKVQHNHPLLSLDKTKSIKDLDNFVNNKHYCIMAKMDGLTCSIKYEQGKLVSAETRGDGNQGENILHNVKCIKNLPLTIAYQDELIIDGEAIITYNDFKQFESEYANPRNLVAGSIRLLDSLESARRSISFVAWKVYEGFSECKLYSEKLDKLDNLGFATVPRYADNKTDSKESLIDRLREDCSRLFYPIDGVVLGIDNIVEAASMGNATSHHERYQIAYKFYDETIETELEDIVYDVSKQGVLTPVGVFKTIKFDDAEVSRASLYNLTCMKDTLGDNPYIGQKIEVAKMNMIIPKIVSAEKADIKDITTRIEVPKVCPVCGKPTEIKHTDRADLLLCTNDKCNSRINNLIKHYCDVNKGVNIRGISEKTIEFLMEQGWLKSIKDLYNLDFYSGQWKHCRGWGEVSVEKILKAIKESRTVSLDKIISAMSIPEIGLTTATQIAEYFGTWENFRKADKIDFLSIDNIGSVMADYICNFDYTEFDEIVDKYLTVVNCSKEKIAESISASLEGKIFVITGKLSAARKEVEQDIKQAGGKVSSSVSSKTTYLVNNDVNSTSSKNMKAKELGVSIITEEELYNLIKKS